MYKSGNTLLYIPMYVHFPISYDFGNCYLFIVVVFFIGLFCIRMLLSHTNWHYDIFSKSFRYPAIVFKFYNDCYFECDKNLIRHCRFDNHFLCFTPANKIATISKFTMKKVHSHTHTPSVRDVYIDTQINKIIITIIATTEFRGKKQI